MIADIDKELELTGSRSAAEEPVASSQSVVGNLRRFRFPVWDVRADRSAVHDARGVGRRLRQKQPEGVEVGASVLCSWLGYEHIREVQKRRYLLQPIALEIFSNDERTHLLAFLPQQGLRYQRLLSTTTATGLLDSASQSVAGQKRLANVE
ncbi:hypothetical protein DAPPUDRAFT_260141 [Daphnia pulex]|uniref:BEACH-type PH domain-containing protein n=1 Tax=Daphnia pulex TaxID=6669 RepID=E9HIL0_DAPPU|nr:hypothetical protein DAPPUDRAFT_260141 [Daphnia pulex]|eukprot:EFX68375.1 hypothetical protein DAPPUDRAFT_260141 [Daphnia pulex]